MEPCNYCGDRKCDDCPLPFTETKTYEDLLNSLHVHTNHSFYFEDHSKKGRKDVIIQLVFSKDISEIVYKSLQNAKTHPNLKVAGTEEKKEGAITLYDCLEEFKNSEILDEDNKWYCNKCKEHVQATKSLQIYNVPPVLVISLKRFKTGKQRYNYGGGGG